MVLLEENPYFWDLTNTPYLISQMLSLKLYHGEKELHIANLSEPIQVTLPNEEKKIKSEIVELYEPGRIYERRYSISDVSIVFLDFDVSDTTTDIVITVSLSVYKNDVEIIYLPLNLSHSFKSQLTESNSYYKIQYLGDQSVSIRHARNNLENVSISLAFVFTGPPPPSLLIENEFTYDTVEKKLPWNVTLTVVQPSCKFWNETQDRFDGSGCEV